MVSDPSWTIFPCSFIAQIKGLLLTHLVQYNASWVAPCGPFTGQFILESYSYSVLKEQPLVNAQLCLLLRMTKHSLL